MTKMAFITAKQKASIMAHAAKNNPMLVRLLTILSNSFLEATTVKPALRIQSFVFEHIGDPIWGEMCLQAPKNSKWR